MLTRIAASLRNRFGNSVPSRQPIPLPPGELRMGGRHFKDDEAFVRSATEDVRRLNEFGLQKDSRLLDWGCGAGRLAVGVRERWGRIGLYHGVDVQKRLIDWAEENLTAPGFTFSFVDIANARYNKRGAQDHSIPGATGDYDAFYAYSVFSHMLSAEARPYLAEIRRLLSDNGFAFFTAFVEDSVVDEAENPEGYGPMEWRGPLHCVRFERSFFDTMVTEAGLTIDRFEHGNETDGQSMYVVRPAGQR
ncbi:class I SAM-dependent methyltransferase [Nocardioides sambongensis]|uniref:class I SAM-dependent methyltransferase n=1 Tax=Nocardioides sambongensis TaxID=2589074 RepID=UPI0011298B17|nr:class I SAM-dependent methyltransferase [Nocardioides sambongensis]